MYLRNQSVPDRSLLLVTGGFFPIFASQQKRKVAESTQAGKLPKFPGRLTNFTSQIFQLCPLLLSRGLLGSTLGLQLCHLVFHLLHLEHLTDDLMVPCCLSTFCSFTGCFKSHIKRTGVTLYKEILVPCIILKIKECRLDKMISPFFPRTKPESSLSHRNNPNNNLGRDWTSQLKIAFLIHLCSSAHINRKKSEIQILHRRS